ncbi:hypothetical protein GCM10007094_40870 [Pseudovibrio japonicus]|uniref:Uncharacterized protein n=1 Tax=Pseudovibrio japonicus TaxID=366534 RepID=A0ABQ3EMW2_9HYPH|nr:hypothetical protein [Pseudovibrio japonicus]GHB47426.1 hypothetical protein GCM10007094_40870 [Pseudovibrio japonicus]
MIRRAVYIFLSVVLVVIAIMISGLLYIVEGVRQNAVMSAVGNFFPRIVSFAIQERSLGYIGVPKEFRNRHSTPPPKQLLETALVLRSMYGDDEEFDCHINIAMEPVDLYEHWPADGSMLSLNPLRYLVVFDGPPPDISDFLDLGKASGRLKEILPLENPSPVFNQHGDLVNGIDLLFAIRTISRAYPNGISWTAKECTRFTYIMFEENR